MRSLRMVNDRDTAIYLLKLLMLACILCPLALFAYAASATYQNTYSTSDERIERSLDVVEEYTTRIFQVINLAFETTDEIFRASSDNQIRDNEQRFHERLQEVVRALRGIDSIWLFDKESNALVSSRLFPNPPNLMVSDRKYFQVHVDRDIGTYIGEVLKPKQILQALFIPVTRRRFSRDGAFSGVIEIAVLPDEIHNFYARLGGNIPGASYALVRGDGTVLARYPTPPSYPDQTKLGSESKFERIIQAHPQGAIYDTRSVIDGVERRIGVRKLPDLPIYLSAGISIEALRNEWLGRLAQHLVFGVPATLLLWAIVWLALKRTTELYKETARRAEMESSLRQAQKMEAIGQLTGGVAHDFNNILMIISGNLDLALRRGLANSERLVQNALTGSTRAAQLTQRLLAFARRQPLDPKPISPNKLISGMADLLHRALGEKIQIEIADDESVWQTRVDISEFEAAVLNLALNARDAMPDGGRLRIETDNVFLDAKYCSTVDGLTPGEYVLVSVSDTGTGIAPETISRVFEPFFTTKQAGEGTGLGLSQVYGFAKQSGGHVRIYSELGQGTTVNLYFPRLHAETEPASVPEPVEVAMKGKGEKLLLVEDEPGVRSYIEEILQELGYAVFDAPNGEVALKILDREKIDLLLTDIVLPGMNGREVAEAAKRKLPSLKILYMTGYSRSEMVHGGRLDPGVNLLQKPITQTAMSVKIRNLLDAA
ncbi:MAG TPA: ATP-binding protein [Xanthobacteraceae bacterium]|jgi:two-component system NtrC family sensor kinase|nr:ATP-binding protein [Xanthobacteraceae bacterium]